MTELQRGARMTKRKREVLATIARLTAELGSAPTAPDIVVATGRSYPGGADAIRHHLDGLEELGCIRRDGAGAMRRIHLTPRGQAQTNCDPVADVHSQRPSFTIRCACGAWVVSIDPSLTRPDFCGDCHEFVDEVILASNRAHAERLLGLQRSA